MVGAGDLHRVIDVLDDFLPDDRGQRRPCPSPRVVMRALSSVEQASSPPHVFDIRSRAATTPPDFSRPGGSPRTGS